MVTSKCATTVVNIIMTNKDLIYDLYNENILMQLVWNVFLWHTGLQLRKLALAP